MKNKSILLVEDNKDFANAAKDVLEDYGYEIIHVKTYEDAINAITTHNFHFIFIDGFFPFSYKELKPWQNKKLSSFAKELLEFSKNNNFEISTDMYLDYLSGNEKTPLGLLLAEELEKQGVNNYLITSAINHHYKMFSFIKHYCKSKSLNLFLYDALGKKSPKLSQDFWEKALKAVKELVKNNTGYPNKLRLSIKAMKRNNVLPEIKGTQNKKDLNKN